jgi:hypothetical protein
MRQFRLDLAQMRFPRPKAAQLALFACSLFNQLCTQSVSSVELATFFFNTARNLDTALCAWCKSTSVMLRERANHSSAASAKIHPEPELECPLSNRGFV